jgi:PAS domain S-box-containing protein
MKEILNVLCLEDSPRDAEIMRELLIDAGYNLNMDCTALEKEFVSLLRNHKYDIILSDFKLPGFDGFAALRWSVEICPDVPFICVSGTVGEETAIELLKKGAVDYILKDRLVRLPSVIDRAIEEANEKARRQQVEKALSDSELRYRRLFEAARDGILILDSETGKVVDVNQYLIDMLGFSHEQFLGKCIWELGFFSDIIANPTNFAELIQKEYICSEDRILRTVDDRRIEVEFVSHIYYVDDHKMVQCNIRDITERKCSEERIFHERRMLRTLIDNLPDLIYVKDIDCRKVIANKADVRNIGYNKEAEVLGKTDIELFPGQTGKRGYTDDKEVISSGKVIFEHEEDFIDKQGVRRWLLTTKIPLHDKQGNITGLVGIGHDITERKRVEKELIKAKDKAEEGDRLKTAFLHNISHEIRTPMNAIVGFSTLLGKPGMDELSRRDYIEVIQQSSNHLLAIISDIVDIANIEANLVKIVKNKTNVNLILQSSCDQFILNANEKKIKLVCETTLSDSDALVLTDRAKLTQILTNLINNAIKFTDKGYVKVDCRLRGKFLEFSVSDTGIGIPQEFHEKIFDRFYQVQNTLSRLYEGTGLGLAISKAHIELMGGKIWLTSEPGMGTTFYFTIPYEKQDVETLAVNEERIPEDLAFSEKKTILVAEDIDSNFELVRFFLSNANAEIIRAANGKLAVEKFLSNKNIDLILMDIKMPVMDGFTAVKLIREVNSSIPIIAQTAYIDDKEQAIESGCSAFISKPFDKMSLLRVIHEFI